MQVFPKDGLTQDFGCLWEKALKHNIVFTVSGTRVAQCDGAIETYWQHVLISLCLIQWQDFYRIPLQSFASFHTSQGFSFHLVSHNPEENNYHTV